MATFRYIISMYIVEVAKKVRDHNYQNLMCMSSVYECVHNNGTK